VISAPIDSFFGKILGGRNARLPEVAVACARIDGEAAAAKDARSAREVLADPKREQEACLLTGAVRRRRKDGSREDRSRNAILLVMEEAVFDAEFYVPCAASPAFERCVREAQRKGGSQLHAFNGAVIEVEPGTFVERRPVTFSRREGVNLPVASVGRHRIVSKIWRTRYRGSRCASQSKRGHPVKGIHAWASA
jgi:hypothetical protein